MLLHEKLQGSSLYYEDFQGLAICSSSLDKFDSELKINREQQWHIVVIFLKTYLSP
jgi:hypothetical protein